MVIGSALFALNAFDGEVLGPVLIFMTVAAIPIVSILTRHQRKMAEIIHGANRNEQLRAEFEALRTEVAALKGQLMALSGRTDSNADAEELARRLG